ncbi:peroxisomal leader peptide-processing protease-like [Ruditapes philippinarum]|uniref:peroxisomal leader peptide-processing protease-like n=1 Tax=Ruditapes philippinarum TaxID=129788 RepID=UPI00295B0EE4|nr:peroxisomal leader peptide-processing protease-like [Ruditapes philippinarum]XP_060552803.1 peroxisomal leader peptide-processing protease-like [Ruditapes philippinarum]XP_060552804.1 peroxisomal leader peptide-processing protease-like [Ruditapes philippinarum]XP_060552805.1 peroxisomal leader peptide-processing protease-like [Ruditapes philippinarum]XP_060552806.1 peroxisomal leader peptide-processing protease-like [Ruditapes philippinarum]XP_060552807.1 peroxisomal leader peptide-processi
MLSNEDPYSQVCIVSMKTLDGKTEGTASAILIDSKQGLVLTHASVLYPLIEDCDPERLGKVLNSGSGDKRIFSSSVNIEVTLPNGENGPEDSYFTNDNTIHPVKLLSNTVQDVKPFIKCKGKFKTIFECRRLTRVLNNLMPSDSWQFVEETAATENKQNQDNKTQTKAQMCYKLLSFFVLIKLQNMYPIDNVLMIRDSIDNKVGDLVEICATPFGSMSPEVFLNAKSRGILSNVAGPQGILLLTDARCVPGSEGGALFYCHKRKRLLAGIMIASLCWKNNEWVGLSLACAISEVLGCLKTHLTHNIDSVKQTDYVGGFDSGFIPELLQKVRCVNVGHNWGSGVVIDSMKGLILTCSHVLNDVKFSGVSVNDSESSPAQMCNVIYRTPLKSHFDIALIQQKTCTTTGDEEYPIKFGRAVEGEVMYVIGHAIFRGKGDTLPMVCRGIVSKIVRHNNVPVMLQTTCAVHAGASGGGVFNTRGQLVALVVCNSKDTVSGAYYPHVNMCVPIETVASIIKYFIKTNDADILRSLHVKNNSINRIWSIGTEDCKVYSPI